jgi:TRAP-type C4-dicarboxylate transport system permease small subunit
MKKNMLIEEWVVAVLLSIMVLMVAAQVLSRYVFHTSLSYTEELVRYFFVWATFLGIAAAAYHNRHLSIAAHFMPESFMKWARLAAVICALLFAAVICIYGLRVVLLQIKTHQTTAALGMPMWVFGLALPVSSIVLVVRLILIVLRKRGVE